MLKLSRLGWMVILWAILIFILTPERTYAQWPPFDFEITPTSDSGKITYRIYFSTRVKWVMTNLTFKIPLPEGTRFVEAKAPPTTEVGFDGQEITFLTPSLLNLGHSPRSPQVILSNLFFTVEVIDPSKTVYTTKSWIAWEGDQPGSYLLEKVSVDITQQPLIWNPPAYSRLQLELSATVLDEVITYTIYPQNLGKRMWDVKINIPVPEGTTFLSAEAPPSFTATFAGREVSFSTVELAEGAKLEPLKLIVSTTGVTAPFVTTHAWASWRNVGGRVVKDIVSQEETRTGDLIVQPPASQWVVADMGGDVPFSNYDLTSVTFQEDETTLKITLHTAGPLEPGEPLGYALYIDSDCHLRTGEKVNGRGIEYRVRYKHDVGRANVSMLDLMSKKWGRNHSIRFEHPAGGNTIALWVPYHRLNHNRQFCWVAEASNNTTAFNPVPPPDFVPNPLNSKLRLYNGSVIASTTPLPGPTSKPVPIKKASSGVFIKVGEVWQFLPGWSEPAATWKMVDFDNSSWFSGATPVGYGDGKYATDLSRIAAPLQSGDALELTQETVARSGVVVASLPSGETASVYLRRTFSVPNPAALTQLSLEIEREGGFVAYLNGVEVARRDLGEAGSPITHETLATAQQANAPEVIDLSNFINNLVAGVNVLAFQVHKSADNSNLSITPKLSWKIDSLPPVPANDEPVVIAPVTPAEPPPVSPVNTLIRGKLVIPLDNGQGFYDLYLYSLHDSQELVRIPYARQPNFRFDGQRLLMNREGSGKENIYEYNMADGTERQVSDALQDWLPFYDPGGNRVVYANAELTYGSPEKVYNDDENKYYFTGVHKPFIFVQCGLLPPHQEKEPRCRDIPSLGVLIPAGQMGEIQGTHPVWTANDMIAFKACNSWAGFASCGIYSVPSTSTKGFSNGFIPRQLTHDSSDTPSDTKGNFIAFTSNRDGNWEAYVMDLNGAGVKNLSNSPTSNDGLPTISPDLHWVAFVSDRGGRWAVWVTSIAGGSPQKLFDLPIENPWASDDKRIWLNERISWGP